MLENKRKVIIYAGDDVSTLKTLNRLVPGMLDLGLIPVIAFPEAPAIKPEFQSAALNDFDYFDRKLLNEVIIPEMDKYEPLLEKNGSPKSNIYYTPKALTEAADGPSVSSTDAICSEKLCDSPVPPTSRKSPEKQVIDELREIYEHACPHGGRTD